jgi:hypothetical protein
MTTLPPNNYSNDIKAQITSLTAAQTALQAILTNDAANLTPAQQQSIMQQINGYQTSIAALTGTVGNLNQVYATNLQNNSATLGTQTNALNIISSETVDANNQISYINDQKINKMRQVQINNYYAGWYQEQIKLLKYLVIYVLVFSGLFYLKKINILPNEFFGISIVLITLVLLFFVIPVVLSILRRDNMNYSEYDWGFDKTKAPPMKPSGDASNNILPVLASSGAGGGSNLSGTGGQTCIGAACCPVGSIYDATANKCSIGNNVSYEGTNYDFSSTAQDVGRNFASFWNDATSYSYSG